MTNNKGTEISTVRFVKRVLSHSCASSPELFPGPCYQPEILSIIPLQSNVLRVKCSEILKATSRVTNHAKTQNV